MPRPRNIPRVADSSRRASKPFQSAAIRALSRTAGKSPSLDVGVVAHEHVAGVEHPVVRAEVHVVVHADRAVLDPLFRERVVVGRADVAQRLEQPVLVVLLRAVPDDVVAVFVLLGAPLGPDVRRVGLHGRSR